MKIHRNVTPRQEALAERNLYTVIAALRTPEECRAFLRDLCTPAELQAMADRWAVVEFLKRGLPYREIHRVTGVSVTTIGRVARFLGSGNGGYAIATQRLEETRREHSSRRSGSPSVSDTTATTSPSGTANGKRTQTSRRVEVPRHG
jgi:TrpR-related protein YerC/YecD